jgi:hypothetical protein
MEKIYSTPVKNYIQRNGFVMVSNLLLDFQQELGITESELSFIIKIMKNKNGYAIHDKDLDPTVCTKTLSRKRNSLKEKGLLNFSIIKSQDLITGTFKTDGISYDLSPLEEKLQIISDNIESKREKEIKQHLTKQNKIVETNENSPLETFKKDYLNYYGVEYILNDFEIKKYKGIPKIIEEDKCDELFWADINDLPEPFINYEGDFLENKMITTYDCLTDGAYVKK